MKQCTSVSVKLLTTRAPFDLGEEFSWGLLGFVCLHLLPFTGENGTRSAGAVIPLHSSCDLMNLRNLRGFCCLSWGRQDVQMGAHRAGPISQPNPPGVIRHPLGFIRETCCGPESLLWNLQVLQNLQSRFLAYFMRECLQRISPFKLFVGGWCKKRYIVGIFKSAVSWVWGFLAFSSLLRGSYWKERNSKEDKIPGRRGVRSSALVFLSSSGWSIWV